jgi:hypothetical protein
MADLLELSVERFGGLDVLTDPQDVGWSGATALLNVDLSRPGQLSTRMGSAPVSGMSALGGTVYSMGYYLDGSSVEWLVVLDGSGTTTPIKLTDGSAGSYGFNGNSFARYGDETNRRLYVAGGGTSNNIGRFNGSTWTNVSTSAASPYLAAVTPISNRLAVGGGATAFQSRVGFSDAGDPESWGSDNWVDLWPGDGEHLSGLIAWRELLFAFKQTKFAVFTGESVVSDGSPAFDHRGVMGGHGAVGIGGMAVAGDEGVYFGAADGFYLTTGGPPVCISRPLEPWLRGGSFDGLPDPPPLTDGELAYFDGRLYAFLLSASTGGSGSDTLTLMFDPKVQAWTVWQAAANGCVAVPRTSTFAGVYFGKSTKAWKFSPADTSDNGTAIDWSYASGYVAPAAGKRISQQSFRVFGSGSVNFKHTAIGARSSAVADTTGTDLTLGVAPDVTDAGKVSFRKARQFGHVLTGTGPATVTNVARRFIPSTATT